MVVVGGAITLAIRRCVRHRGELIAAGIAAGLLAGTAHMFVDFDFEYPDVLVLQR